VRSDEETKTVTVNCRVTIKGFEPDGEEETYWIVEDRLSNLQENKLPASSPLARVLIGARVGEDVPFHPPSGEVSLTIVDVGPA
jgi:transcription elongation GreA/GreB family factor